MILAKELLDWDPQTPFRDGVGKTIEWYVNNRDRGEVRRKLETMLTER